MKGLVTMADEISLSSHSRRDYLLPAGRHVPPWENPAASSSANQSRKRNC